ncbi:TPA: M20 family peptidase [Candidatus Poribacteria bacterium]|nr:M20 family peptidase [Candidatus Poribacteria bacterium]
MPKQVCHSCQELLQAMIAFNTVNSNISGELDAELALSQFLESQANFLGFSTQRLPIKGQSFNLLVSYPVSQDAPWLLFESHLDTVSIEEMTIDPLGGQLKNNRIYGRGACDTKGSGAAMLYALKRYAEESIAPNNIAIVYTVDEEVKKTGVRTFIENHLSLLDWKPVGAIVGEPTQLKLVIAHNGVVRWRIQTQGIAAHSSSPERGLSAISMMMKVVDALESRYIPGLDASHALTGRAQCSVNVIRGGTQVNIVPASCEVQVDRRVVPGEKAQSVIPAVEDVLNELRRNDDKMNVLQTEPDIIFPPLDPTGNEAFIAFVQGKLKEMQLSCEPMGVGFGTNASSFNGTGIPAIIIGPGDIAQAHTSDEWIDLEQLRQGEAVYLNLMRSQIRLED